jgi:hypothetical protein
MRRLEKRKAASHSWTILQQALGLNQVGITLAFPLTSKSKNFYVNTMLLRLLDPSFLFFFFVN